MTNPAELQSDWGGDTQFSRGWWRVTAKMVDHGWVLFCRKRGMPCGLNMREIRRAEYQLFLARSKLAKQRAAEDTD